MDTIEELQHLTTDTNRERILQFKKLFPDLFTNDSKLNLDELKGLLGYEITEKERYEFRWYGKANAKKLAFSPSKATLVKDTTRCVNSDKASHVVIEGENLEVLKLLKEAYHGEIKCIYIDPPYNTGKDFIYTDNFTENKKGYWENVGATEDGVKLDTNPNTNGRHHSNWLSMMYSRLLIARQLLKSDGVIFVSIDDNEVNNLRKLMDDVFGEENFISCLCVVNNIAGRSDKKHVALAHEYVLMYSKSDEFQSVGLPLTQEQLEEYKYENEKGEKYRLQGLRKRGSGSKKEDRPNMWYAVYYDEDSKKVSLKADEFTNPIKILPKLSDGSDGRWRWGKDTFMDNIDLIEVREVTTRGEYDVFEKDYLFRNGQQKTMKLKSYLLDSDYTSDTATSEFREIFSTKVFNNPKSVYFLKDLIRVANCKNEIVLDFFAGSGATGQAVVELNKEDGGNRRFILVQIPEVTKEDSEAYKANYKKISDITIERLKRVIQGYGENPTPYDAGFDVFKLVPSNFPRVAFAPDPEKSPEENLELLKSYIAEKESSLTIAFNTLDVMVEVLLKNGFKLDFQISKQEFEHNEVFLVKDDSKETLICLDFSIHDSTISKLIELGKQFICLQSSLDTNKKWNLSQWLNSKLVVF